MKETPDAAYQFFGAEAVIRRLRALTKLIERPTLPAFRWFGFEMRDGDFNDRRIPTRAQVEARLERDRKSAAGEGVTDG